MLFLTVPTAGTRNALLEQLMRDSGLPPEQIVLIRTKPDVVLPEGGIVIDDFGAPNIQRWWHLGIEESVRRGASAVAVLNDDIRIDATTLSELAGALSTTGAAIASPVRPEHGQGLHKRPLTPYSPRLWGAIWVLNPASGLRPDPRYVWWYGDNDLDIRARRDHGGVVSVDVPFEHVHAGVGTSHNPALVAQTDRDWETFESDYGRLLRVSRLTRPTVNAWRRLRGKAPLPS